MKGNAGLFLDFGKLTSKGEEINLRPLLGSEARVGSGGEEPFVKEELEPKTGGEDGRVEGEFFEVGAGKCKGGFFVRQLCAEKILCNGASGGECCVAFAQLQKGIEKGGVLEGVNFPLRLEIDPFR